MKINISNATFSSIVGIGQKVKKASSETGEEFLELNRGVNAVSTILIVGVNGTGKTTTTAKLANLIKNEGNKVLLAAADTFRAAAVDQLQTWANRIDIEVVTGAANGDPASVAFSAISKAKSEKYDCLIVDTAGRLHTKNNLMSELEKIIKVIEKQSPINEILLVIDATTGQNGINQAKNVYVALSGVMSLYAAGRTTGLVCDAGDGVSHTIPVFEGFPIPHAAQKTMIAGRVLTAWMQKLLQSQGITLTSFAEM